MGTIKREYTERDVRTPINGATAYVGYTWACIDGDPARALFFGTAPQCNINPGIMDKAIDTWLAAVPNVKPVYIAVAYVVKNQYQ